MFFFWSKHSLHEQYQHNLVGYQLLSAKYNKYHWQRKSVASSTPLLWETSGPSGALSSGPAYPGPTADWQIHETILFQTA